MAERPDGVRRDLPSVRWRSSTVRLIALYGAFFLVWSVVLVAAINWQTTQYLDRVVGEILEQRVHYLASVDRDNLPSMMAEHDLAHRAEIEAWGRARG